jgi:alpha-amylase
MVGEVYDYDIISSGKSFDFGDKKVNYYDYGFDSMINFEFKKSASKNYEELFSTYSEALNNEKSGFQVLNYATSHDDANPFDKDRNRPVETGTKLLLTPGTAQIYYGDESARNLTIEGTQGDATFRSNMNWDAIKKDEVTQKILSHWQKLGKFRKNHPSIGAGQHKMISESPYIFKRTYQKNGIDDSVIIGIDLEKGAKQISAATVFDDNTLVRDAYSGTEAKVQNGMIMMNTPFDVVLLEASGN